MTCFCVVRLIVRVCFFFISAEHSKVLQFAKEEAIGPSRGVNPRGCSGRSRHYFAEVVIHYHYRVSNNSFPGTQKCQETDKCGIIKPPWQFCFKKLHLEFFKCTKLWRLILCPVQRFVAGCLPASLPKPTLASPFLNPRPQYPYRLSMYKTHTGCRSPVINIDCPYPKPLQKYIPFSVNQALNSASHFRPQIFRTDRRLWTSPAVSARKPKIWSFANT